MAITQKLQTRACSACHAAKVKCIKEEGSDVCKRCIRLGLKCVEHVSRQGQGTRRRKKVKKKDMKNEDADVDEALLITSALSPMCSNKILIPTFPTSTDFINLESKNPLSCQSATSPMICQEISPNVSGQCTDVTNKFEEKGEICVEMNNLKIEDNFICKTISNGMGRDHYGLNNIIRQWVALAFSRRSFSLLARASFIAAKLELPMDDIISNQSQFAAATDSQPMDFLANDLLLAKNERKTLGYPVDLMEVPWDLLDSVQIDRNRPNESVQNRWAAIRWSHQGTCRFWTSPLFARDFTSAEEMGQVWEANDNKEVIDLFLPKHEKGKFAQDVFNIFFVNNKPHMECFVTKNMYKAKKRNTAELIDVNVIMTMKLVDLDTDVLYFEFQPMNQVQSQYLLGNKTSSANKRGHSDDELEVDPLMTDGIEFTDISMTDEMEEFLKLLSGE